MKKPVLLLLLLLNAACCFSSAPIDRGSDYRCDTIIKIVCRKPGSDTCCRHKPLPHPCPPRHCKDTVVVVNNIDVHCCKDTVINKCGGDNDHHTPCNCPILDCVVYVLKTLWQGLVEVITKLWAGFVAITTYMASRKKSKEANASGITGDISGRQTGNAGSNNTSVFLLGVSIVFACIFTLQLIGTTIFHTISTTTAQSTTTFQTVTTTIDYLLKGIVVVIGLLAVLALLFFALSWLSSRKPGQMDFWPFIACWNGAEHQERSKAKQLAWELLLIWATRSIGQENLKGYDFWIVWESLRSGYEAT